MPLAPPVMTATFPSSFPMLFSWTLGERDVTFPLPPPLSKATRPGAQEGSTVGQMVIDAEPEPIAVDPTAPP